MPVWIRVVRRDGGWGYTPDRHIHDKRCEKRQHCRTPIREQSLCPPLVGQMTSTHCSGAYAWSTTTIPRSRRPAAARSILGSNADYVYVHSFRSDQYEHKLEYAGHTRHWDHFDPSVSPHQMLSVSIGEEIQSWISMARWRRARLPGDELGGDWSALRVKRPIASARGTKLRRRVRSGLAPVRRRRVPASLTTRLAWSSGPQWGEPR
jgi:hypothetical protein